MGNCFSKTRGLREVKRSSIKPQTPEVVYHKIPEIQTEECSTLKLSLHTAQREKEAAEEAVMVLSRRVQSLENVVRDLQESVEHASLVDRERKAALHQLQHKQTQLDQLRQVNSSIETEHIETLSALNKLVLDLEEKMRQDEERRIELTKELLRLQKEADEREKMLADFELSKQDFAKAHLDLTLIPEPPTSPALFSTSAILRGEEDSREAIEAANRKRMQRKSWNQNEEYNEDSLLSVWAQKGPIAVCVAKYNYDPFELSPNENPEVELPLTAGSYVLVVGEMDEDGFFDGELIDGTQGLVPSNYIEKIEDEDLLDFHEALLHAGHNQYNLRKQRDSSLAARKEHDLPGHSEYSYTGHSSSSLRTPSSMVEPAMTPFSGHKVVNNNSSSEDLHRIKDEGQQQISKTLIAETEAFKSQTPTELSLQPSAPLRSAAAGLARLPWPSPIEEISEHQTLELSDGEDDRSRDTDDEIDEAFRDYPNEGVDADSQSYSESSHTELSDIPEVEEDLVGSQDSRLNEGRRQSPEQSTDLTPGGDTGSSKADGQKLTPPGGTMLASLEHVMLTAEVHITEQARIIGGKEDKTCLNGDKIQAMEVIPAKSEDSKSQKKDKTQFKESRTRSKESSTFPKEGSRSPKECSTFPKEGSRSPKECSTFPKEGSRSPKECSMLPKEGSIHQESPSRDLLVNKQKPEKDTARQEHRNAQSPSAAVQADQHPNRHSMDSLLSTEMGDKNVKLDDSHTSTQQSRTHSHTSTQQSRTHSHRSNLPKLHLDNSRDDLDLSQPKNEQRTNQRPLSDSALPPLVPNKWTTPSPVHPAAPSSGPGQTTPAASGPGQTTPAASGPGQTTPAASGPGQTTPAASGPGQTTPAAKVNPVRLFIALFDYDPATMSPNLDSIGDELPFREGQILKVLGHKDADGFYKGENKGKVGYIPCNMVCEIQIDDPELLDKLLQEVAESPEQAPNVVDSLPEVVEVTPKSGPAMPKARKDNLARQMTALFDYNTKELSPFANTETELSFRTGDLVMVYGDVDQDGFYNGEVDNKRGLVPANFLRAVPTDDSKWESTSMARARSCESLEIALEILERSAANTNSSNGEGQPSSQPGSANSNKQQASASSSEIKSGGSGGIEPSKEDKSKTESFFSRSKNILRKLTR